MRFVLFDEEHLKLRWADELRQNLAPGDPARKDDDLFALTLLESVARLDNGAEIVLQVLPKEENG